MARMLQALKNLEARSPRPAPGKVAKKAIDTPRSEPAITIAVQAPAPWSPPAADAAAEPSIKVRPTRRADAPPPPATSAPVAEPAPALPTAKEAEPVIPAPDVQKLAVVAPALSLPLATERAGGTRMRPPCNFERLAQRMLSDPVRSKPLMQLAERLRQDAEQTACKTLALVGVGSSSSTHPTLFYAAALLAGSASGAALLIDADVARRPLSEALEYGEKQGLGELLGGEGSLESFELPTAVNRLSFLPAGRQRHLDISTAGPRLQQLAEQVAARFTLVLLDAGRTDSVSASTVARVADATYFVVQLGGVDTSEAQAALRDFRAAGARVLGCIAT